MSPFAPFLLSAAVARSGPSASPPDMPPGPAVESVTLAEALASLTADNPRTAAARTKVDEARADVVAAKTLPNPVLDYEGTRLRSGTNTGAASEDDLALQWPVPVFGQLRARKRAATAEVGATEAHVEADLAGRAREVRAAFGDLIAEQERTRILEEARADLDRVATIVAGRRDAGEASDYETVRLQTELNAMDASLGDARGDLADARGRLATLLGKPGTAPRAAGELRLDASAPLDVDALWTIASERLPALVAAREDEAAARAALASARRDAWPVPVLSGGTVGTSDAESRSATFGVSIPLPAFDRNQGAIARAQARLDGAELERKALEAESRADLERAVRVATERRAALAELDSGVSPRLPEMRTMAEAAYREGRGDILELLDAFRSLTATRLARVDAYASAARAEADLLYLTGRAGDPAR